MLSVIIPHYNRFDHLKKMIECLQGIQDIEVILVDDASTEKRNFDFPKEITFIQQEKNAGPAHARNVGAQQATFPNLLFVDSDVHLNKENIEQAKSIFQKEEVQAFIAAPSMEPISEDSFQRFKTYLENFWAPAENFTSVADTKFLGIRKKTFEEVGGFNESYTDANVEDYEFGYRLLAHQIPIHFIKGLRIQHDHGIINDFLTNTYQRTRSWMHLQARFGRSFDNHGTSFLTALSQLAGLNTLLLFLLIPFNFFLLFPFLLNVLILLVLTSKLWMILMKRKERLPFYFYTAFSYVILSVPVMMGALRGLLDNLSGRSKKQHESHTV